MATVIRIPEKMETVPDRIIYLVLRVFAVYFQSFVVKVKVFMVPVGQSIIFAV